MNKKGLLAMVVVLLFVFANAFTFSAAAESNGRVIYSNDFSGVGRDETMTYLANGKTEIIKEKGEAYLRCIPQSDGGRNFKLNFGPEEAKNVDISLRIRLSTKSSVSTARFGIFFRSPSIPAYDTFSYQLCFENKATSLNFCDAHADTVRTTMATDVNACVLGLWYNVKVCLRGNRIVVYVNGNKIFDCEDEQFPAAGGFGLSSYCHSFDVDDLVIVGYTGKTLPEPTPNEAPIWVGDPLNDEEADLSDTGALGFDLMGNGGEKGDDAIGVVDPNKLTVNSFIAIGLIIALILMAASTFIVSYKLIILLKEDKKESQEKLDNFNESNNASEVETEE